MMDIAPPPPGVIEISEDPVAFSRGAIGQPGITLDRVHFSYDDLSIVHNVTWEVPEGESAVITGHNGCGKSTLLYVAAGLLPPAAGAVLLAGHPIAGLLPSTRVQRGLRVGFVFQEGGLLANLDCISNVTLALRYHFDILDLDEEGITARAEEALSLTQLARSDWSRVPAHLSFGNRKRLAMARALAIRPNFFFFDDPDVGMDPRTAKITHQILCMLRDDPAVTLLVATNRPQLIERLGVSGFRLSGGKLTPHSGQESIAPSVPQFRL
jgi:phospholipid/cholesterol/gamma-HCH transport system ATP-binding protein